MTFRCAAASLERDEPLVGTASTVRAFLLVEHPGPWGVDAWRDARLPDGLGEEVRRRAGSAGVRPLLVRRPGRGSRGREGVRVFAGYATSTRRFLETVLLPDLDSVPDLDIEALGSGRSPGLTPYDGPVLAVCTHGRHDSCCAERGRPVAAALTAGHPEATWEVSHIGGDRFAANLLVLPWGLYFGRLDAESAPRVAAALLAGELDLDHLRGRSCSGLAVQVAEVALRRSLGERRIDAVRAVSQQRSTDGEVTQVGFEVDRSTGPAAYTVRVRTTATTHPLQLTCRAQRRSAPWQHEVLEIKAAA